MQHLAELCELLIENSFGSVAARIFSSLAKHGRLALPSLREHTRLPPRRLKTALYILTQHQIVLHHAGDVDEPTFFQVDWYAAYVLARSDKIAQLVDERYGEEAGDMLDQILQLGHASIGDLVHEVEVNASSRSNGVNGDRSLVNGNSHREAGDDPHMSVAKFHKTMGTLLKSGFLTKVNKRSFIPQSDLDQQIGDKVLAEHFPDGKATGPKKQQQFKSEVNRMKRKWQEEDEYSSYRDAGSNGIVNSSVNKRAKLTNGTSGGETVPKLPNELVVRVNFVKCVIALRSQRLERMAGKYLGSTAATVYSGLLRAVEDKSNSSRIAVKPEHLDDDEEEAVLPGATDMEVMEYIDHSIDLASSPGASGSSRKKGKSKDTYDEDAAELGIKQEDDDPNESSDDEEPGTDGHLDYKQRSHRLLHIGTHLENLAESPKQFCTRVGVRRESRINFTHLTNTLIQSELDTMIHARFGPDAARLVRMLRSKGKLEERQIAQMTMMRIRDIRAALTALQFHGFAEAQELPKDATRQPSRTVYLWYFDQRRAQSGFLQNCYVAMARALQRLRVERQGKYRGVIEKAERTDVRGREQELLTGPERNLLREWREVEERLLVTVARLDDVVAVLRDFSGTDTSLET